MVVFEAERVFVAIKACFFKFTLDALRIPGMTESSCLGDSC